MKTFERLSSKREAFSLEPIKHDARRMCLTPRHRAAVHVYEVRPRKDKRGVKQKAFSKLCVHDPLQPTLQSAQAFPLSGAGHRAHTVTG